MIPGMYFVYSLSCEGYVFYIGMTNDLATRYKSHLCSKNNTRVSKHIQILNEANKIIHLTIIAHLPRSEAQKREQETIYLFSQAGHCILNDQHKYFRLLDHRTTTKATTKQEIINRLKRIQHLDEHTYCCLNHLDYEQTTTNKRINSH